MFLVEQFYYQQLLNNNNADIKLKNYKDEPDLCKIPLITHLHQQTDHMEMTVKPVTHSMKGIFQREREMMYSEMRHE